ncbi:MAG TPA: di-heme oxidoredictase family protein [Bryobacteraceae bacterium]|jgi:CxxC motif-containing protein (DUF1111 family)
MFACLKTRAKVCLGVALGFLFVALCLHAQSVFPVAKDPGVRTGPSAAGQPIAGLGPEEQDLFAYVLGEFNQVFSVSGEVDGEVGNGLGPGYNGTGCAGCHAFPAVGGSSPAMNPQIAMATSDGARNLLPSFVKPDGPVVEARFLHYPDGSADGGVHNLFTIAGRTDATGCQAVQPDFNHELANNNVSLRIATPTFGDGLIDNISDETILANQAADSLTKRYMYIGGHPNRNPNDGTITKFGWKGQNKSLIMFSGEAYNVEMGVTNELFPSERNMATGCDFNTLPEDHLEFTDNSGEGGDPNDVQNFSTFMRFLAPPKPQPDTQAIVSGRNMFNAVGCPLCHTPSLTTGPSDLPGLDRQQANLYSDLLVHHMGAGLADGIQQGNAGPDEFRTAPLWGLGQRIFFLHDGRTKDLIQAIEAHRGDGAEANTVIFNYDHLQVQQQQDLLTFLRSL